MYIHHHYQMYLEKGITITSQMAGLMCAAILSDTLMFRSPTCTQIDREAALRLAEIAEVKVEELASAMFQAGSNFDNKTEEEILNQDFKIFHAEDVSLAWRRSARWDAPNWIRCRNVLSRNWNR